MARHALGVTICNWTAAYSFEPLVRAKIAVGRPAEILPESEIEVPGFSSATTRFASMTSNLNAFIATTKDVLRQDTVSTAKPRDNWSPNRML